MKRWVVGALLALSALIAWIAQRLDPAPEETPEAPDLRIWDERFEEIEERLDDLEELGPPPAWPGVPVAPRLPAYP